LFFIGTVLANPDNSPVRQFEILGNTSMDDGTKEEQHRNHAAKMAVKSRQQAGAAHNKAVTLQRQADTAIDPSTKSDLQIAADDHNRMADTHEHNATLHTNTADQHSANALAHYNSAVKSYTLYVMPNGFFVVHVEPVIMKCQ
jgi:hypothetical protein